MDMFNSLLAFQQQYGCVIAITVLRYKQLHLSQDHKGKVFLTRLINEAIIG